MAQKRSRLSGPKVTPHRLQPGMTVVDLVKAYAGSGAYQGGRLAQACRIYGNMIKQDAVIGLTLSGAMTPAGMGGALSTMLRGGFVDWIVSTGANLFHDLHFALGLPLYQGDFQVNDSELREKGIDRIYDLFLEERTINRTERFVIETFKKHGRPGMTTAEVHNILGKVLLDRGVPPESSLVTAAALVDAPIYTSSPGDSVLGMDLACLRLKGVDLSVDPLADVIETAAIVMSAKKNGVVIVGGGSPKNFYLQTQPFLEYNCGIKKGGHDFDVQIGVDAPHWGGLSGATPSEAVSWGKVNPAELEKNSVVVYSDATIALPILFGHALSEHKPRRLKRLYKKRDKFTAALRKSFDSPL